MSKDKLAVAQACGGVRVAVPGFGIFGNAPASVERLLKKLSGRGSGGDQTKAVDGACITANSLPNAINQMSRIRA